MEELGQVFISPDMVPAVRIMLDCIPAGFRPVEWRATSDAMAAWENQALIVVSVTPVPVGDNPDLLRRPTGRTIAGIPAKWDDSLPTHSLYLYGEREAA